MLLSEVLKKEMQIRHLTIGDLAEASGLSYAKVNSYTKGTVPKSRDLQVICECVGIDSNEIVFEELNISVDECAKTMQKSNNFVRNMVRKGVFGFYDGSTYHIPRAKFEEYMYVREQCSGYIVPMITFGLKDIIRELIKELQQKEKTDSAKSAN